MFAGDLDLLCESARQCVSGALIILHALRMYTVYSNTLYSL
jgi:hypothetical protein